MIGYEITQSSTAFPLMFYMVLTSDHITGATGLSPTVTISKNGASFGSPSGAVTEVGKGWYKVAGNATDTATLGPLALDATAATADPSDALYPIVAVNPQSTAYGLSLAKTTNITGFNDIAASAIVSSGAITTSSGAVSTVTTTGTLTTYTGNTPQTGDSFARLGAPSGASIDADILTRLATSGYTTPPTAAAIGAVVAAGAVASVAGNVGGDVVGSVGSVAGNVTGGVSGSVGSVTGSVGSVTALVNVNLTQTLSAARALDAIADTSLTLNDAFVCAVASVSAQIDASAGTSCVFKTASTGTTLRTKALTLIAAPTTVPDKAV
jgi:hypothetical protein